MSLLEAARELATAVRNEESINPALTKLLAAVDALPTLQEVEVILGNIALLNEGDIFSQGMQLADYVVQLLHQVGYAVEFFE